MGKFPGAHCREIADDMKPSCILSAMLLPFQQPISIALPRQIVFTCALLRRPNEPCLDHFEPDVYL
jgi:hypothetical protein